ncbi:hypothetical protein DJ71_21160 [Halorubrum sp. E3]|uniref:Uncharacterized protein n=1 Tax=Halorubrum persicum TaxID=1383844 RepID=A0A2G1WIY5_9EURY|nr:hypothetical protein [Halorubrum persicum]OYR69298.1 hypothetical protein DJ71_21160 [Halorubrum sp. E3]PHQ38942.1 hypothetical protein DJ69_08795 [Halorubrum persicum]
MQPQRALRRFVADASAVVRSDERMILLFLVLLSVVALAVFLHYTVSLLNGLPEVIPPEAPAPGSGGG